jgi:hypothetical protein
VLIKVGNLIGKLPSGGWAQPTCIITAQRETKRGKAPNAPRK